MKDYNVACGLGHDIHNSGVPRQYDLLPAYGIMKGTKRNLLHEYVQVLVKQGYLLRPPGEYEVLHTAERADNVLFHGEAVLWRHAVEAAQFEQNRSPSAGTPAELLRRLQQLRVSLALRSHIPSYIVFSNATLNDLVERRPITMEALLQVKGFGEQKARKYGAELLSVISEWRAAQPQKASKRAKAQPEPQPPLQLRPDQLARYEIEPSGTSMTEFARRLTALKDEDQLGELTGRQLSNRLLARGFLMEQFAETDNLHRRPTPAGEAKGILLTERAGKDGKSFTMVTLTEQAQRWLIDRLSRGE